MKANFEINLPSIPGKRIKFKIQDIKAAAFGTQKARFPDNKALLTKKFVDSFHNFHPTKRQDDTDTQADTQLSKSSVRQRKEMQFRSIVSQNKKYLLPLHAEFQKAEQQKINNPIQQNKKQVLSYSFAKAELNSRFNPNDQDQSSLNSDGFQNSKNNEYTLTDNYYFTSGEKVAEEIQKTSKAKPSAVFKNQSRKRVEERIQNQYAFVPGPGSYISDKQFKPKVKQSKSQGKETNKTMDYKHLKDVISNVLVQKEQPAQVQNSEIQNLGQQIKPSHMFVLDDRDRFGEQIFPIAPKLKVPGPGAYEIHNSLEDKAKKLLLVEEQRKLLKQWFNN